MSSGVETVDLIEPWLYSTLSGDATLNGLVGGRINGAITPDVMHGPYVQFALISARDETVGAGSGRIMVDTLYLVKAIMQTTSQGQVVPIARRIDALLHGQNVTLPGGFLSCARRHTVSYPEVVQGVPYLHLGGQFNIVAHSS